MRSVLEDDFLDLNEQLLPANINGARVVDHRDGSVVFQICLVVSTSNFEIPKTQGWSENN